MGSVQESYFLIVKLMLFWLSTYLLRHQEAQMYFMSYDVVKEKEKHQTYLHEYKKLIQRKRTTRQFLYKVVRVLMVYNFIV